MGRGRVEPTVYSRRGEAVTGDHQTGGVFTFMRTDLIVYWLRAGKVTDARMQNVVAGSMGIHQGTAMT